MDTLCHKLRDIGVYMSKKIELAVPPDHEIRWAISNILVRGTWRKAPTKLNNEIFRRTWYKARDDALRILAEAGYYLDRDSVQVVPFKEESR